VSFESILKSPKGLLLLVNFLIFFLPEHPQKTLLVNAWSHPTKASRCTSNIDTEPSDGIANRRNFLSLTASSASSLTFLGFATVVNPTPVTAIEYAKEVPTEKAATSAGRKGCKTSTTPSSTTATCTGDNLQIPQEQQQQETSSNNYNNNLGRVSRISATENGVSTSSVRNPSRYSPPWSYLPETDKPDVAWKSLIQAVNTVEPNVQIIKLTDRYLHALVPTAFPKLDLSSDNDEGKYDDIEFILKAEDNVVLYRSASRTSVFVYPLTQPVSDRNTNLNRLEKIRVKLGWGLLGDMQQGSSFL